MKIHRLLRGKFLIISLFLEFSDSGFINSLTIDGIHIRNINVDNSLAFMVWQKIINLSISNLTVTDMSLSTDLPLWITIDGLNTELVMNGIYMYNVDFHTSPAIDMMNTFSSVTMNNLHFENDTIDGDTSVIMFESIKLLFLNGAIFKNISSSSESASNFMIKIDTTGKSW